MARSNNIMDPSRKQGAYYIKRRAGNCTAWSVAIWNPYYSGGKWLWDGPIPPYGEGIVNPNTIIEVCEDELASLAGVPFGMQVVQP